MCAYLPEAPEPSPATCRSAPTCLVRPPSHPRVERVPHAAHEATSCQSALTHWSKRSTPPHPTCRRAPMCALKRTRAAARQLARAPKRQDRKFATGQCAKLPCPIQRVAHAEVLTYRSGLSDEATSCNTSLFSLPLLQFLGAIFSSLLFFLSPVPLPQLTPLGARSHAAACSAPHQRQARKSALSTRQAHKCTYALTC